MTSSYVLPHETTRKLNELVESIETSPLSKVRPGELDPPDEPLNVNAVIDDLPTGLNENDLVDYSNKNNVTLLNLLVTKDGKPTKYWEGGRGYTNSIVKRVPEKQETEPIKDTIYPSTNINDLVNESVDWLHLDVEGYDHILIKSLNYLPDFIIFEWENLLTNELDDIKKYLKDKGFTLDFENNVSCLAIKNN